MDKVKVALIGYGHLGKWHAQKAHSLADSEFVAIVEQNKQAVSAAKEAYPDVAVVDTVEEAMELADAFLVVTPTSVHFKICQQLLSAKKHVFCEKPICSTLAQAKELKENLGDQGLTLQVGHSERFHHVWEIIKEQYGQFLQGPLSVNINRSAPFKGRATDVDVVQDLMIHDLDLLVHLFGAKEFKLSSARGYKVRTDFWDVAIAEGTFGRDINFSITAGRNQTREVRAVEIINKEGTLFIDLFKGEFSVATARDTEPFVDHLSYQKRDHLLLEQEHFYNSILNNQRPVVSIDDGLLVMEMIEQVSHSLEQQS
jgi:predicted dehydrogenase